MIWSDILKTLLVCLFTCSQLLRTWTCFLEVKYICISKNFNETTLLASNWEFKEFCENFKVEMLIFMSCFLTATCTEMLKNFLDKPDISGDLENLSVQTIKYVAEKLKFCQSEWNLVSHQPLDWHFVTSMHVVSFFDRSKGHIYSISSADCRVQSYFLQILVIHTWENNLKYWVNFTIICLFVHHGK